MRTKDISVIFSLLCLLWLSPISHAAFTKVVAGDGSSVEQNPNGTWCWYPKAKFQVDVACLGNDIQFVEVMNTHIAQGVSISYYGPSLQRLGGAEYPVKTTGGKVFLCLSGRAPDGMYVTQCEDSRRDNEFGSIAGRCAIEKAQDKVTDGCYEPGLDPPSGGTGSASGAATANPTVASLRPTSTRASISCGLKASSWSMGGLIMLALGFSFSGF